MWSQFLVSFWQIRVKKWPQTCFEVIVNRRRWVLGFEWRMNSALWRNKGEDKSLVEIYKINGRVFPVQMRAESGLGTRWIKNNYVCIYIDIWVRYTSWSLTVGVKLSIPDGCTWGWLSLVYNISYKHPTAVERHYRRITCGHPWATFGLRGFQYATLPFRHMPPSETPSNPIYLDIPS